MGAIVIVIVAVLVFALFYGHYHFYRAVEKDKNLLFNNNGNTEEPVVLDDLKGLPKLLADYLKEVGVVGKCRDCHLTLRQEGQLRKRPKSKWMYFTAKQFMSSVPIGFVWAAKSFPMFVKDQSIMGLGETNVSLFGLLTVAKEHTEKTNKSALVRCLAELPLYPVAFLNKGISWEVLSENALKATVIVDHTKAAGVFFFNAHGLIERFEAERYRGDDLEKFVGKLEEYKTLSGLFVPTKMKALWKLKEGDFDYFEAEVMQYRID